MLPKVGVAHYYSVGARKSALPTVRSTLGPRIKDRRECLLRRRKQSFLWAEPLSFAEGLNYN